MQGTPEPPLDRGPAPVDPVGRERPIGTPSPRALEDADAERRALELLTASLPPGACYGMSRRRRKLAGGTWEDLGWHCSIEDGAASAGGRGASAMEAAAAAIEAWRHFVTGELTSEAAPPGLIEAAVGPAAEEPAASGAREPPAGALATDHGPAGARFFFDFPTVLRLAAAPGEAAGERDVDVEAEYEVGADADGEPGPLNVRLVEVYRLGLPAAARLCPADRARLQERLEDRAYADYLGRGSADPGPGAAAEGAKPPALRAPSSLSRGAEGAGGDQREVS